MFCLELIRTDLLLLAGGGPRDRRLQTTGTWLSTVIRMTGQGGGLLLDGLSFISPALATVVVGVDTNIALCQPVCPRWSQQGTVGRKNLWFILLHWLLRRDNFDRGCQNFLQCDEP